MRTRKCPLLIKHQQSFRSISTTSFYGNHSQDDGRTGNHHNSRLIYEGKLGKRVLYLKSVSIVSSLCLAGSYSYIISKKGFSVALAGVGFAFCPFLLSPIVIAWFFKRYVTHLYYNPQTDTYTAHHYGLLLNKKQCSFKKEDVTRSDATSMLNTFTVGKKPFFVHDEDLIDFESVQLYRRMVGLDQVKDENIK